MSGILGVVSGLVKPIADAYRTRQERQGAKETAQAKLQLAKTDNEHKLDLTDAEWEVMAVKTTPSSWKDEYVTIVVTSPIIGILLGSVWYALTGDMSLLEGFNLGISNLTAIGVDMGEMMLVVVYAAVGLKFWRGR